MTIVHKQIPFLMTSHTVTYNNDTEISNGFNNYFHSVYINSSSFDYEFKTITNFPLITLKDFKLALNKFSSNTSSGPGGVPVYFLKNLNENCHYILSIIFNQFIKYNYFPKEWKTALVTPLYKNSGDIIDIKSYRPISVTNIFSRIFERIMANRLEKYLKGINFISKHQHGFQRGKNTLTNVLETYNFVTSEFDKGESVDVLYIDFEKAFDKVDIGILLNKLLFIKTPYYILNWLTNFLLNRRQRVRVRGAVSDEVVVKSGVPQGCVISPLLFAVYVNDIFSLPINVI